VESLCWGGFDGTGGDDMEDRETRLLSQFTAFIEGFDLTATHSNSQVAACLSG